MTPFEIRDLEARPTEWHCRVHVPTDCPYFQGHFPGRPVLPAVAQLELLTRVFREAFGSPARIHALRGVRLRRPVLPGQMLQVRLERPRAGGYSGFEIRHADEPVCAGAIRWGPAAEGEAHD